MTLEVKTGTARINGAALYYERAGKGPDLVLVHAGTADLRMWDGQFTAFARGFRVLRYDMRGYGRSPMAPGLFSHRDDLYALLRALGIARAILVGCSMGGQTVVDFTLQYPVFVAGLVLVSASVSGYQYTREPPQDVLDLIEARRTGQFERAADLHVRLWADGPIRTPQQVDAGFRARVREMSLNALNLQAAYLKPIGFVQELPPVAPALGRLDRIEAPALVLHGDLDDEVVADLAGRLAAGIPGARQAVIAGAAHLPNMEQPEKFNRLVLDFLQSL